MPPTEPEADGRGDAGKSEEGGFLACARVSGRLVRAVADGPQAGRVPDPNPWLALAGRGQTSREWWAVLGSNQ